MDAKTGSGLAVSPALIAEHELFHANATEETIRTADDMVRESMTAEEYDAMRDAYKADYAGVYDFANMSVDEIERLLTEEIAADAYAGLNWFSGNAPVQEAVRTETERNAPVQRAEAQQETTGPPGRTMVEVARESGNIRRNNIEYTDNAARNAAQKALHDRMVSEGKTLDLTENRENASQYFPNLRSMPKAERTGLLREKIQALKNDLRTYLNQLKGVNFEFKINGNTIEATVYNAGIKEVLQNLTQDKAGMLSASEEIFRNAEYLYSTQDKTGSSTVTGWDYFYVPVKLGGDAVGVRIAVRNTVKPREAQIYNWGIKREGTSLDGVGHLPKGSNSADVSSDVSSTATIRQTEGNSQEKSSGRASVAGINARTADSAALRRAEALEKSGTDNETIRQETGWYRGRDGKWRFEIDDSGMKTRKAYVSEREKTQALREYTARFKNLTGDGLTNEQRGMLREYVSQRERGEFSDKTYQQLTDMLGDEFENFAAALEGKMSASAGKNDLSLAEYINHPKLFEAYPDLKNVTVRFDSLPDGQKGYFSKRDNTIVLSDSLFGEETDVVLHELQHVIQNTEGFTGGASPQYWNREATYNEATEKYRDNRARLLHGLSAEDRALYDEYRSTDREMGAMLDGSMLYDESRMDALEKRSDELYRELYGKEWFGKLNRYDRILGDASEAVKEFYLNTAGEIEARDTAARRRMTAEERKKTPPDLGDADTVFADGTTAYSINENFKKDVDDWLKNTSEDMRSTSPGYFRVGTTSEALQSIGARTDNIYMRKSKIGTILEEHPEVDAGIIKSVPNVLENPVLVMKSLTRPDSIVVFGEEKARNGSNLMVALELTPKPGGRTEMEFSLVTSAYGRSDENVQNLINNSELLYLDTNKNRADTWLMQLRVQFPSRQPPYGSIGNIAYAEDGVKITGKKLSELGGVVQKASSGRASVEVESRTTDNETGSSDNKKPSFDNETARAFVKSYSALQRVVDERTAAYQKATKANDPNYDYETESKWLSKASQELEHCELFHAQAVRLIREYGSMRSIWEYEHDRIMEREAMIRMKLTLYDGR